MRRIGSLPSQQQSTKFVAWLQQQGIAAQADPVQQHWEVWIHREADVDQAKALLGEFEQNPDSSRFEPSALPPPRPRPKPRLERELPWDRPIYRQSPVTIALIAASILVTLLIGFGRVQPPALLSALSISVVNRQVAGPLPEVRQGQIWRLITPAFLHFHEIHLLFNMLATWRLARSIEFAKGSLPLLALTLLIAVVSNVSQYLWAGPYFGGMSGVCFGWFGYLWIRSTLHDRDLFMPRDVVVQMLLFLVLCSLGLLGPIANTAHISGLVAGMILAWIGPWAR